MRLIIDIPEDYYKVIKEIPIEQSTADMMIIRNGTPLPQGCGRLVDADRLEQVQNERLQNGEIKIWELKLITSALDEAETVVEADGGAE